VCGKKAVVSLPYGPHAFCRRHFLEFFEKRVRKNARENRLVEGREKIVVAYSGGKDSGVTLCLMKKIFGKSNPVEALLIDEGIPKYRDSALEIAEKNCRKWKIPFKRVSFEGEFGFTMVDVMRKTGPKKALGSTCSYCGVLRRKLLNRHAREMGAGKIATGHNLDDEAQSVIMNVFDADMARFRRLGPKSEKRKGFVQRIKPLCTSPEKDIIAFARLSNIRYFEQKCCPFRWQAKRNDFRETLDAFEEKYPGTKYSIMRFFGQAKEAMGEGKNGNVLASGRGEGKALANGGEKGLLGTCAECGEPCSGKVCKACKMAERIGGKADG